MNIHENIKKLEHAKKALENHCMAQKIDDKDPRGLIVYFPPGYRMDGVLIRHRSSIAEMYEEAERQCEKYWKLDML